MGDGVGFANVGKELVAEPFALGRAFNEARDVHERHTCWDDLFGPCDLGQCVETCIRHGNVAHVGLNCAEREIRSLRGGSLG